MDGFGVRDQRQTTASGVEVGRVQHQLEDEVELALDVVRIQDVGLIEDDCQVDTVATRYQSPFDRSKSKVSA